MYYCIKSLSSDSSDYIYWSSLAGPLWTIREGCMLAKRWLQRSFLLKEGSGEHQPQMLSFKSPFSLFLSPSLPALLVQSQIHPTSQYFLPLDKLVGGLFNPGLSSINTKYADTWLLGNALRCVGYSLLTPQLRWQRRNVATSTLGTSQTQSQT